MRVAERMVHAAARALAAPRARRAHTQLPRPRDAARPTPAAPHRACSAARLAGAVLRPGTPPSLRAFAAAAGNAEGSDEDAAAAAQAALPAANVSFIGSAQNAYVKHAVKLRTSRSYREAAGTVLLSGGRILEELSGAADGQEGSGGAQRPPLLARVLLLAPGAPPPRGVHAERTLTASPEVLRKVVGVESGDSLDAVAELCAPALRPLSAEAARSLPLLLLLDGVQDPGNLGTLLRSAAALRASGAVLLPGCCDAFNAKAVRAARGACFRLPLFRATWPQLAQLAQACGAAVLGADPRGDPQGAQRAAAAAASQPHPVWLALGAEGPGLTQAATELCTPVAVPGAGGMESLNVATAGSILLYILSAPKA